MDETAAFYDRNAQAFFDRTVDVDMSSVHARFLARLPAAARILDAGTGSGRDAKAFADLGHEVTAFDASAALARLASRHCGFEVAVRRFEDVDEVAAYDGVWCCASLLHLPRPTLPSHIAQLWRSIRPGGAFYASFKLGDGDRVAEGRSFTDMDEARLRELLQALPGTHQIETWISTDQRPERGERWVNVIASRAPALQASPALMRSRVGATGDRPDWSTPTGRIADDSQQVVRLVTGGADPLLPHLSHAFPTANRIDFAVAFVTANGLRLLIPDLESALAVGWEDADGDVEGRVANTRTNTRVRVLTSDYLDVTEPQALRRLLLLQAHGAEVKVFTTVGGGSFHLKAYIFSRVETGELRAGAAFIGSSNITGQALREGLEWNYRVAFPGDPGFLEARRQFEALFDDARAVPLTDAWIDAYAQRRIPPPPRQRADMEPDREPPAEPNAVQREAMAALAETRRQGYRRGLVVLATGLGKTWLAAFDSKQVGARRVLFMAHREEILSQAAETFLRIRPEGSNRVGFYMGAQRDAEVDVLCASVQTLSRAAHLERFPPQHFDYVIVDEFHHASAATYRRLLAHFAPSFLLGLTATPDRTDQSDILSLCDDNLVFSYNLFKGIESGLLSPFHYVGIEDKAVDYREIPWRNGRFDPQQLSNKLATLARARHALDEWRQRAQQRTLAFCVSTRHADYMARQFQAAGISAASVHAQSVTGRAEALERLKDGSLQVIFSVDLFHEGMDLPQIDTVMMLRPTESKILFLQQLGRGLRRSAGKERLVVLDFIGNHRSFLHKPEALFQSGSTYRQLAEFARKVEAGHLELPLGCYVNFDLAVIDFLKSLDSSGPRKDYEALRESLGRRPTLSEFYRSGASVSQMRQQHGGWFRLVAEMGNLESGESEAMQSHEALLRELEVTNMTKSFKMVLLEALLELDGLSNPPTVESLSERSWQVLKRRQVLLRDLPESRFQGEDGKSAAWRQYWRDNPINAWVGGNKAKATTAQFKVDAGRFGLSSVPAGEAEAQTLAAMLQELVDYRLATYQARSSPPADATSDNVVPFPQQGREAVELPYFPNLKIACGHFREGRTDSEEHRSLPSHYGHLDPARHFIARAAGNSMNGGRNPIRDGDHLLLEHVTPSNAGSIIGTVMAIERDDVSGGEQYVLRVVTKSDDGQYVLRANNPDYADMPVTDDMRTRARLKAIVDPLDMAVGQVFSREEIPPLFGETFNPGNWNSGHVTLPAKKTHVLLVTLNKQGKADEHRYHDYWIDEHTFHWQTQNSTTPGSKKGREIIDHARLGIAIHLFVRETKLSGGKGAPFTYFGRATYLSHMGSAPMSVELRARR